MRRTWFPLTLFILFTVLIVWDIAEDLAAGTTFLHIVIELLMIKFSFCDDVGEKTAGFD